MATGIVGFDQSDGLPPFVVQKLNANFQQLLAQLKPDGSAKLVVTSDDSAPEYGGSDVFWYDSEKKQLKYSELQDDGSWAWTSVAASETLPLQEQLTEVQAIAEATGQHFWADDNGVHVTAMTQAEWGEQVSSDTPFPGPDSYPNILINSMGILLRDALNYLMSTTGTAISFYDGQGDDPSNVTASFGSDGMQIGKNTGPHIVAHGNRLSFMVPTDDGKSIVEVAYISIDDVTGQAEFYMTKAVVTNSVNVGTNKWKMYIRNNNNLSLKWNG